MALRIVADRVDKQLHDYMHEKRIRGPWKSGSHLLVAIDYSVQSTRLLRWAKNLAYSMGANIQGIYVETSHQLTAKENDQLNKTSILQSNWALKSGLSPTMMWLAPLSTLLKRKCNPYYCWETAGP